MFIKFIFLIHAHIHMQTHFKALVKLNFSLFLFKAGFHYGTHYILGYRI